MGRNFAALKKNNKMGLSADTEYSVEHNEKMNRENNEFNAQQAQLDRDFQAAMQDKTLDWNERMWQKNNEYNEQQYLKYNTPAAQLRQAQEAGINPNMVSANGMANSFSPAQAVSSSSSPSGAQASAGSGSGIVSGKNTFEQIVDGIKAVDSTLTNGASAFRDLLGIPQMQANTRLTKAEARKLEIENERQEHYDKSIRSNLCVDPDTGEVKLTSDLDADELASKRFEPLVTNSFNRGDLDARRDMKLYTADLSEAKARRFKSDFESIVSQSKINGSIELDGKQVSYADIIARLEPQTVVNLVKNSSLLDAEVAKVWSDVHSKQYTDELAKENIEFTKAQTKEIKSNLSGNTPLSKAIEDAEKNGLTLSNVVNIFVHALGTINGLRR